MKKLGRPKTLHEPKVCSNCGQTFVRDDRGQKRWKAELFCSHPCAMMNRRVPLRSRFEAKVSKNDKTGCWNWTSKSVKSSGYGAISIGGGKTVPAHRLSYEWAFGNIPAGLVVRHKCDNKRCVNPAHLELGTKADNGRDAIERNIYPRGEKHKAAKVTDAEVKEIRKTNWPAKDIAALYGISAGALQAIRSGIARGYVS